MNELRKERVVILSCNNWYSWDRYIKGAIRRKNAYDALNPPPVDPRIATTTPAGAAATAGTSQGTAPATPTDDEIKIYRAALEKWNSANDVAVGVILGSISASVELVVDPDEPASVMYNKLKAHALKQSSGTSALTI